jgi:hypothetical protein
MTSATGLSRHAAESARVTGDRPDLWLAGALSAAPFLAWLPLIVTVAAPPRMSDLAFIGAGLLSSGWFPWNLLLLAGLAVLGVLLACVLAALGEAGMLRAA